MVGKRRKWAEIGDWIEQQRRSIPISSKSLSAVPKETYGYQAKRIVKPEAPFIRVRAIDGCAGK
jgi:hypothetical protein